MTVEDFTTYTEVDPNNHISKTAYHVDFQPYRNEDAYLYKDKGASYFMEFTHYLEITVVSGQNYFQGHPWALTNEVDDINGLKTAGKTFIDIQIYKSTESNQARIYIDKCDAGVYTSSSYYLLTYGTKYYLKIVRTGTSLTLYIYSDFARSNLLSTLTLTTDIGWSFRYVFAANTWNSNNTYYGDIDIDNLDVTPVYIIGTARDANGNALSGVTTQLFRTSDNVYIYSVVTGGNGMYMFYVLDNTTQYFIRAYKDGTPNIFGTTDRNLVGA